MQFTFTIWEKYSLLNKTLNFFDRASMSEEEKAKYLKEKKEKHKQELKEKQLKLRQVLIKYIFTVLIIFTKQVFFFYSFIKCILILNIKLDLHVYMI